MTTIIAWAIQGPYFPLAYLAKGIEVALITLVIVDFVRVDGSPIAVVKREMTAFGEFVGSRRGSAGAQA
jgi:hypothetical protein